MDLLNFLISFSLSGFLCFSVILTSSMHGSWTNDGFEGVQKIHDKPTPRIGGLPIILCLLLCCLLYQGDYIGYLKIILLSSIPVIFFGFLEDITKKIKPIFRFLSSMISAFIFIYLSKISLSSIGIIFFDNFLTIPFISILFAMFCISGLTNSINIIDGFNGLASGSMIIMISAFLYIAWYVGDEVVFNLSLIFIASNIGFLLFNFPYGRIFLGDGGAYFSGFYLSIIAIMLPERNPEISPWVCLLICSYPIIETMISILRKTKRKGHHFSKPDKLHLHMLVYRDLSRKISRRLKIENYRNPITSIILWFFPLTSSLFGVVFFRQNLLICFFIIIILYIYIKFYRIISIQKS